MSKLLKLFFAVNILHVSFSAMAETHPEYNCQANTQTSAEQCETLVNFYHSTGGPDWTNKDTNNWLKTDNACDWKGVTCWGSRVVLLQVFNNNLKGQLPDLSGLPHLLQIGIFGNKELTGLLPDLTLLPNLTKFIAHNTGLEGFLPDVENMPNLTDLVVQNSNLYGPLLDYSHLAKFKFAGSNLCLSPKINYSAMGPATIGMPACQGKLPESWHGEMDMGDFGIVPDDGINDHDAIGHIFSMLSLMYPKKTPIEDLRIFFPAGTYNVEKSIRLANFKRLTIEGQRGEILTTRFVKGDLFGNNANTNGITSLREGAIFDLSYGDGLVLKHLSFEGQMPSLTQGNFWWDHGVYVASTKHAVISDNEFLNIGDTALFLTTDPDDISESINSMYHMVYNNYFYNITQTSTTSTHSGSSELHFIGNTAENVKGAMKFATRREGASHLNIMHNRIVSAGADTPITDTYGNTVTTINGIEIEAYKNINISENIISDGRGVGIVVRSSQSTHTAPAFDWGNVTIVGNEISNYRQGIIVSNLNHARHGNIAKASNINVSDNLLKNMWNGCNQAAIHFLGRSYEKSKAINNTIIGGKFSIWPDEGSVEWLHASGNNLMAGECPPNKIYADIIISINQ